MSIEVDSGLVTPNGEGVPESLESTISFSVLLSPLRGLV